MNIKLFLFLLLPFLGISQVQIGQDIDGETANDRSGSSVSISSDGNRVAIGAPFNGGHAGHVRIYHLIAGTWVQLGQDIDGKTIGDNSGRSVFLSGDGSTVAIGAPFNKDNGNVSGHVRVYRLIAGTWVQLGQDIGGETANNRCGESVSLSDDGSIVAIGSPGYSLGLGHVRIYTLNSNVWTKIGQNINGQVSQESFGSSLSISANGNIIAIGGPNKDNIGTQTGNVRMYENISGVWTQIGQDINGSSPSERNGFSVSISATGNIVAIGGSSADFPTNEGGSVTNSNEGRTRVFKYEGNMWTQMGADIWGENAIDSSGQSVSLSANGMTVAIGAPRNNGNGIYSGHVRLYEYTLGSWVKLGVDIDGEAANDHSGQSVSLTADGTRVAIGSHANDGNGNESGHVRVYDLLKTASSNKFVLDNFNIYPNPTSDILNISLENNLIFEKAVLYNNLGQIVKEANQEVIDVSTLAKGIYFVEVTTNKGKANKKVIIK